MSDEQKTTEPQAVSRTSCPGCWLVQPTAEHLPDCLNKPKEDAK